MRAFLLFCLTVLASAVAAEPCELDNSDLQAMSEATVVFSRDGASVHEVDVRLADNIQTRAAGFQRVCASVIAEKPILFLFENERRPRFHMRNVVAPIEITFIRKNGTIDAQHLMQPYSVMMLQKPTYGSNGPVIAALETEPGYFEAHKLNAEMAVSWKRK